MYPLDLHCVPRRLATWRRAADTSTNRRQGFSLSPHHEHGTGLPTELKLLRSTTTFGRQLKTLSLFQSAYGHRETD